MIEDMALRKLAPKTQSKYIRAVINLTCFLGRSPDTTTAEDLRRYQLHLVFTLPAPIRDIAWYNKSVVYGLLFKAAAETLLTIAADPKHLGAHPWSCTPGARP